MTPQHEGQAKPAAARVDVAGSRGRAYYSPSEMFSRLAWSVGAVLFRIIPRPLYAWRASLLRLFGARIGRHTQIYPSVRIFMPSALSVGDWTAIGDGVNLYNLGSIEIGERVTISQGAHLCAGTHDHRHREMPLIRAQITIGDEAWICADAFVGPDVVIGARAIVGACTVAMRDVAPDMIVSGNPAQLRGQRAVDRQ